MPLNLEKYVIVLKYKYSHLLLPLFLKPKAHLGILKLHKCLDGACIALMEFLHPLDACQMSWTNQTPTYALFSVLLSFSSMYLGF